MLRKSILFSTVLLLTTGIIVKASQASKDTTDAQKAHSKYVAAYNECVRSTPCYYSDSPYGDNGIDYNKCLKSCERFALAYIRSGKAQTK